MVVNLFSTTSSKSQGLEQALQDQKLSEFSSQEKLFLNETINKFEIYKKSVKNWFYCDGGNSNIGPMYLYFSISPTNEILIGNNDSFFMPKKPLKEFTEKLKNSNNEEVVIERKFIKNEKTNIVYRVQGNNGYESIYEFKLKFHSDEKRKNEIVSAEYFYKPLSKVGEGNDRIFKLACSEISNLTREERIDNYLLILDKHKKGFPSVPKSFLVFEGKLIK